MTDAAGRGQHQPPKPGAIKMGIPHEEVMPAAVRCIHCGEEATHRVCDECFKAPATAAYEHDSAMALLARQVSAAIEASHREIDAPPELPDRAREAWADGYTQACDDIRAAIREVASDGS